MEVNAGVLGTACEQPRLASSKIHKVQLSRDDSRDKNDWKVRFKKATG